MSEQNVMDAPSHHASEDFDGNSDAGYFDADPGDGSQPAPGSGLSKSSRRRRRKRKGKGGDDAPESATDSATPPLPFIMEGESLALAAVAPTKSRRQPRAPQENSQAAPQASASGSQSGQQNGSSNGQYAGQNGSQSAGQNASQAAGQAAGGKRWKKKFRDRERRPGGGGRPENPGNDFRAEAAPPSNGGGYANNGGGGYRADNFGNQNGGFKRKNKGGGGTQQRERGFVGPMDHSYRASEAGDAGASTIATNGRRGGHRHHGDSQPIDHSMPRAIPIPENAQTHIYFFIEELFFVAKIQEAAKKLGVKVGFIKNDKEALAALTDGEENKPALIVFDLNNANAKPLTLIPKLKTKLKRSASIVGFLSHLQGDLKAKAVEAGCDVVMPRAAFSQNLPNLLRRYGVEEDEEINFNR